MNILKKLMIKPTIYCFHKCSYCNERQDGYSKVDENGSVLPIEVACRVVEESYAMGCREFVISGGDPLMYFQLPELLRFINRYDDAVVLINSVASHLVQERAEEILKAGITAWNISLDSSYPSIHDAVRGIPRAFEQTLNGLKILKAAAQKVGSNVRFNILTVLTTYNIESIPDLVRFCVREQISSIFLMRLYGVPKESPLMPSLENIRKFYKAIPHILDTMRELGLSENVRKNAESVLNQLYTVGGAAENEISLGQMWSSIEAAHKGCEIPSYYLMVKSNGEVLPCCAMEMAGDKAEIIGNIHHQSISEILVSRERKMFNDTRSDFCISCSVPHNRTLGLVDHMCRQFLG